MATSQENFERFVQEKHAEFMTAIQVASQELPLAERASIAAPLMMADAIVVSCYALGIDHTKIKPEQIKKLYELVLMSLTIYATKKK